ncbi:MAG: TIGR01777 family oxidoreductase [Chloroflexota bacterium]
MRVIVTGATGFIGRALVRALQARSDEVVVLTRSAQKAQSTFGPGIEALEWNPSHPGPWTDAFNHADGVVNLAGEVVVDPFKPWSDEQRARIRSSRVDSTTAVVQAIARADSPPKVLVNQSAIGYYGSQGDTILNEESPAGNDFLAQVVVDWEDAAAPVVEKGVRLVILRTGIVLGKGGGLLSQMVLPFKFFLGGTMGNPGQWVSWIHLDDEIEMILFALTNENVRGVLNATAPNPVTMDVLSRQLGKALGRPSWVPMMGTAMKLALGQRAEAVLSSERVLPVAAEAAGYRFRYPHSDEALRSPVSRK